MSMLVCSGASMVCSFGTAPSNLVATGSPMLLSEGKPTATIEDAKPMANIPPFGMCTSLANPQVAAATAAALGVLTPQPCIPVTAAWIPAGGAVLSQGKPCLTQDGRCMCSYAGQITITAPGQTTVNAV